MFEKVKTNALHYKAADLPSVATGDFNLPALTAGIHNQGLNNYVPRANATILQNVISISANGQNAGATFYQSREFTILQDAYAVKWGHINDILTDKQYIFLTGCIFKAIFGSHSWTDKAGWNKVKQDKIQLPTKDGEIDLEFMETFIRELEEGRINKLTTYLTANGFDNCELSAAERKALADFDCVKWQEYKIGDLFEIENTASLNSDKLVQGCEYDYVTRTSLNQGILTSTGFINKENINPAGTWSLGLLQMDFFYRKKPWYAGQFVRRIVPKIEMQAGAVLFFSVLLNRQKTRLLSVLVRNVNNVFRSTKIQLPTKDGEIDFDFMEAFISAIKKLVIKNVVLYADKKIKTTSQLLQK